MHSDSKPPVSRRQFVKAGTALSTLSLLGQRAFAAHHGGSDKLRVGLIGCGGRGTGAAQQCLAAGPNIELYAMGDFFRDRVDSSLKRLQERWAAQQDKPRESVINVPQERQFTGFDAYQQVIDSGVDLVILATQPGFRPIHFEAAINAGKHVFMEKPVAVDPTGVRKVIAVSELAKQKSLSVVAGTQRHHQPNYTEMIQRVQDGDIGDLVGGDCYWIWGNRIHLRGDDPSWSEMEFQIRNWYFFNWGSGDHICEQHIHNIDVMNWAYGGPPKSAIGMGGLMIEHEVGNIYDHFSTVFEYPNGARVTSMCSQIPGSSSRVGERIVGSKGVARAGQIEGHNPWEYDGPDVSGLHQEHIDLVASIRGHGPYLNHGKRVAESTKTAILGRMAAYTGREISFDWALHRSQLDVTPKEWKIGPNPVPPRPIPGQEKLV